MIEGLTPVVIDQFGGLYSIVGNRGDLETGLAAVADDVEFYPGGVQSRGPFQDYLHTGLASPVNSILSYPKFDGSKQRIVLLANGTLMYEAPEGTTGVIDTSLGPNLIMRGCALANRAFMAFSSYASINGTTALVPSGRPMHWNGQYFDPVGQDGPAWRVTQTIGAGTGDVPNGYHASLMTYTTRSGYETGPCSSNWNGQTIGAAYDWTGLPIGPPNVSYGRFYVTPIGDTSVYYSSAYLKTPDNSGANFTAPSTSVEPVSYTDQAIAAQNMPLSHARIFCWPLPPCIGVEAYNSRLLAWGALNYQPRLSFSAGGSSATLIQNLNYRSGFPNLQFDSGAVAGVPHGYMSGGAGGNLTAMAGAPTQCWKIIGDGATAVRGNIVTPSILSRVYTYPTGQAWRMRIRAKRSTGATNGRITISLTGGATPFVLNNSTLTTEWAWYDQPFLTETDSTSATLYIQVDNGGATGILQLSEWVAIDGIWVYPAALPTLNSYLLASQPNDPETFDYVYGLVGVRPGDGQSITNCVELRGVLFIFKERSTFALVDNGQNPNQWVPTLMSDTVGCLSPNGAARGDGWLVTATQSGIYKMAGGSPDKLSQEIQPDWATVNWAYRHLAWAVADTDAQRVYVGVPTSGATYVNAVFVLDYAEGWGPPIDSPGRGRRWSIWTPPASPGWPCGAYIERDNGSRTFVVGGGVSGVSGYVSKRDITVWGSATDTFGAATPNIAARYDTSTVGQKTGRSYFGYALAKVKGNGSNVALSLVRPNGTSLVQSVRPVVANPLHDIEWQFAQTDTHLGLSFTNPSGGAFAVWRASAYLKPAPFAGARGHNQ